MENERTIGTHIDEKKLEEKRKALEPAIQQLEKVHGKGSIMKLGTTSEAQPQTEQKGFPGFLWKYKHRILRVIRFFSNIENWEQL